MVDVLTGTFTVKAGHAQMLKGGVIMDVVNAEQAKIAEEAGAVAVMALERVPADIRADGVQRYLYRQSGARPDAEGRRNNGCGECRTGEDRRGGGAVAVMAHPRRHPR